MAEEKRLPAQSGRSLPGFIGICALCLLLFFGFGYIAVMSFFQTCVFDPARPNSETVQFLQDNLLLNLLFTALFAFLLFRLRALKDFFAKINPDYLEIGLAVYVTLLGLMWVCSVNAYPYGVYSIWYSSAAEAAAGEYSSFTDGGSYYNSYPGHLGFVLFSELLYRIFGSESPLPVQVLNVLCLGSAYFATARITRLIFRSKGAEFFAVALLAGLLQPVLSCTLVSPQLISMTACIWAALLLVKYFRSDRLKYLAVCAALTSFAVMLKTGSLIYLFAFVAALAVHSVKYKKLKGGALALAMIALCFLTPNIGPLVYGVRAQTSFGGGIPFILKLDEGLQESSMASGWHTELAMETYAADSENARAAAWENIGQKQELFGKNPGYAFDFFSKKLLSQWNEPSFESILSPQLSSHYENANELVRAVFTGSTGQFLQLHFNFYIQIFYFLFAVGAYLLMARREAGLYTLLLPLAVLLGFGCSMLLEAKSLFVLPYIPLMIPTAAYALKIILLSDYHSVKRVISKLNQKKT